MIKIVINDKVINKFNDVVINLRYDSVSDTFSFKAKIDSTDKNLYRPLSLNECKIYRDGVLIVSGLIIITSYDDEATPTWATFGGYTKTGVLEDCNIGNAALQVVATIAQSARNVAAYFGLDCVIDSTVENVVNATPIASKIDIMQSPKEYLSNLCKQVFCVLSHTADGKLLLTAPKIIKVTTTDVVAFPPPPIDSAITGIKQTSIGFNVAKKAYKPIFDFTAENKGGVWTKMNLRTDAQRMHKIIYVIGQSGASDGVSQTQSSIENPYIGFTAPYFRGTNRVRSVVQTEDIATSLFSLTARAVLGDELKAISLKTELTSWSLNGTLATPNNTVTVTNSKLFITKPATFFIESVQLNYDESKGETATINCVLPECYTQEPVKNIFL